MTQAVAPHGFYYAPDPSSQQVCTIGGNVAENSGGAHCLKHGFTVNHVTALRSSCPTGSSSTRRPPLDSPGPDLLGAFVGSEGTLGIATEITLRVLRRPEAVRTLLAAFDSTDEAGRRGLRRRRRRDPGLGDGDHGPADARGGRGGGAPRATRTRARS